MQSIQGPRNNIHLISYTVDQDTTGSFISSNLNREVKNSNHGTILEGNIDIIPHDRTTHSATMDFDTINKAYSTNTNTVNNVYLPPASTAINDNTHGYNANRMEIKQKYV